MKSLPLKLGLLVVLVFSVVIATCLLWTPVRVRWYVKKYRSSDAGEIVHGVKGLLSIGRNGAIELEKLVHDELRNSTDKRRILLIDALVSIDNDGLNILSKEFGSKYEATFLAKHWTNCCKPLDNYNYGRYPLHFAAWYGLNAPAMYFIAKGADVDAKDDNGRTPLHYAAIYDNKETAAVLIEKGADVNAKDSKGRTPLDRATCFSGIDMAALLIEKGADVNSKANDGRTPLHKASVGDKEKVALLIKKGADVNAKAKFGWTPLHDAAKWGQKDIAALLLEAGADVNAKRDAGDRPLDVTHSGEVRSLLRAHGGKTAEEIWKELEDWKKARGFWYPSKKWQKK